MLSLIHSSGPLGNLVGQVIAIGFNWLNDYAGWVIPFLMGAFCPFFVMTGMHYCFAPIQTIQYATLGYGTILGPGMLASNIAQGTAALVVGFRTKNKELKQVALSAGVTGLMGITEPALYGVTPVSYTHLDVYKRQLQRRSHSGRSNRRHCRKKCAGTGGKRDQRNRSDQRHFCGGRRRGSCGTDEKTCRKDRRSAGAAGQESIAGRPYDNGRIPQRLSLIHI